MVQRLNAYNKGEFYYSFTENTSNSRDIDALIAKSTYTFGSGALQANVGVTMTGSLLSGNVVALDLRGLTKNILGAGASTVNVGLSGVRYIGISNTSTSSGVDMTVTATGTSGLIGLFNGQTGNLMIKPYSYFSYNDPYGELRTGPTHNSIQLNGMMPDGVTGLYSVTVLGDLQ